MKFDVKDLPKLFISKIEATVSNGVLFVSDAVVSFFGTMQHPHIAWSWSISISKLLRQDAIDCGPK